MYLTKHKTKSGSAWALDGKLLQQKFNIKHLMQLPQHGISDYLCALSSNELEGNILLPPVEPSHEIWACGVTYSRSREAREAETEVKDIYDKVYEAVRPELFLKAIGWRTVGHKNCIRVRNDSKWNVPEPELTLALNSFGEIIGYTVGNDVSSRDIEGENPLYLPQAKMYDGSCAIGPGILICDKEQIRNLPIQIEITRGDKVVFADKTQTSRMKRSLEELASFLMKELSFPNGVFLMTGTGIVPPDNFSLQKNDIVKITIATLTLENKVQN